MAYFQTQNPHIWFILEVLAMEDVIFYGYLVNPVDVWYNLWLFGTILSHFGMYYQDKSGNPGANSLKITYTRNKVDTAYLIISRIAQTFGLLI
jgi:hypothetical protein